MFTWGLDSVEDGILFLVDKAMTELPFAKQSLVLVDKILYKGLEQLEQRIPAVTYPPELLLNMTKDYLSVSVVRPVVQRADSVKRVGLTEACRYGELAASRLDTALDAADRYLDKYLPEPSAEKDAEGTGDNSDSKTAHAIQHVNRISRKLQRRLTKRTIAEAKALRQQSITTIQGLLYLADLMVRDPKLLTEKMQEAWVNLSQDEPENQVPPANLEQLVAMLVRESARRLVHLTNFTVSFAYRLPGYSMNVAHFAVDSATTLCDYFLKVVHMEGTAAYGLATIQTHVSKVNISIMELQKFLLQTFDKFLSHQKSTCANTETQPKAISSPAKEINNIPKETETNSDYQSAIEIQNSSDDGSLTNESISSEDSARHN